MKTEAAILVEQAQPLVMAELEIPALNPGQVLVEISFSGACGTQVMEWRGDKGPDRWLPHCLGHEGTGVVLDTGASVSKVKKGEKVVLSWIKGAGIDAGGANYMWDNTTVNAGGVTTFQRHAVVSENRLSSLPAELSPEAAILLGCAAPTGMGAVLNVLEAHAGHSVVIFGTGGIGLNAAMAAGFAGAVPVIGVDPNPARRELALKFGCTHVIDPVACDVTEVVREICPGGADFVVEATGLSGVMRAATDVLRSQGGRMVVIGNAKIGDDLVLNPGVFNQGKSILGTWGGDAIPERDYPRFAKLLATKRYPIADLLSKPYRLSEATHALDDLANGRVGRPLIDMSLV